MEASGDSVMVAQRRADVADLNVRARARLRAVGQLEGEEVEVAGEAFAVGDRVVIKRNDLRLGVTNGQRGTVVAVDAARSALTVECGGRRAELDREFLELDNAGWRPVAASRLRDDWARRAGRHGGPLLRAGQCGHEP